MKLAVRDENLLVGRLEKYNRRKSPRAAIGNEKGDRFVPDYEVKALAKVFNVSYESLLDD